MPSILPKGLELACVIARDDPRDALITRRGQDLSKLQPDAIVGTSSLRRMTQLLHFRKDLRIASLRGNLDTRIRKLHDLEFDAIVVALAGVKRMAFKNLKYQIIPTEIVLPCACQGAIAIEIRKDNTPIRKLLKKINDQRSLECVNCERAFLKEFGGGCRLPLAALAVIKKKSIYLEAAVISLNGETLIRLQDKAPIKKGEQLGRNVARALLKKGGREILESLNHG